MKKNLKILKSVIILLNHKNIYISIKKKMTKGCSQTLVFDIFVLSIWIGDSLQNMSMAKWGRV